MKKQNPAPHWLGEKRRQKALERGARKYIPDKQYASPIFHLKFDARQVLRAFMRNNAYAGKRFPDELKLDTPRKFDLIDNPAESVRFLQQAAAAARSQSVHSMYIDQSKSSSGLSAEVLLCCIFQTADANRKKLRGKLATDEESLRKAWTVGTPAQLDKRRDEAYERYKNVEQVKFRHTVRKYSGNVNDPEPRNAAVANVVAYFNRCLQKYCGAQLNDEGRQRIGAYLGEVAENAETHSGMMDWTIAGYLSEGETPVCEIAVCNFGRTIAESFLSLDDDDPAKKDVLRYLRLHKTERLFSQSWNAEALATVIALQEGQTSLKRVDPDRGGGTGELIEFFQSVGDDLNKNGFHERPVMSLISGATHILFDGRHRLERSTAGRRVISFNASKTLTEPPDPSVVQSLPACYFPGTVLSLRFPLPRQFTQDIGQ